MDLRVLFSLTSIDIVTDVYLIKPKDLLLIRKFVFVMNSKNIKQFIVKFSKKPYILDFNETKICRSFVKIQPLSGIFFSAFNF